MSTDANARGTRPTLGHIRGLDGIRAFAVLSIIAFHTGLNSVPGRLLRRRRLLRALGLPHHVAAGEGVERDGDDPAAPLLGRPGPPPAAGALPHGRRGGRRHGRLAQDPGHPEHRRRRRLDRLLRLELVLDPHRRHVLQPLGAALAVPAHLVAGDRGAVLLGVAARRAGRAAAGIRSAAPGRRAGSPRPRARRRRARRDARAGRAPRTPSGSAAAACTSSSPWPASAPSPPP